MFYNMNLDCQPVRKGDKVFKLQLNGQDMNSTALILYWFYLCLLCPSVG